MTTTTEAVSDPSAEPRRESLTEARPTAASLSHAIGGRWYAMRERIRCFGEDSFNSVDDLTIEQYRDLTDKRIRWVAESGIPAEGFPVKVGGAGDVGAGVTAFEMLGHQDLSLLVKSGVQWGLFGGAIANLGTERHYGLLPEVIAGTLPGCFAMTETGHGSDVASLETTATYDPSTDELIIDSPTPTSRKDYIGGAGRTAKMAAVFAQLIVGTGESAAKGVHCVLVPLRDDDGKALPGVELGDCAGKAGLLGVDNGRIVFNQVRVARLNLLNRFGDIDDQGNYSSPIESASRRFFTMLGTLVRGRVSVAGGAGAATRSALTLAVRYASVRRQFRNPATGEEMAVLDYLAHQRKLLPAVASAYALAFAQNDLVSMLHDVQTAPSVDESSQRELETLAAGLKAYATDLATTTIQTCREACGGAGYLSANRLPHLKADTDVFTTFEGDNTVLRQLVAKSLLTEFKETFGDLDTIGLVGFASKMVAEQVVERTSVRGLFQRVRGGADHALTSREEQERLLSGRETHLLEGLARRLQAAKGKDSFAAFNAAQDHLIAVADAHIDRVVFESFVAGIEACADPATRDLLNRVCDLFALHTIERHRAWYLEHDRLSPERSKSVIRLVNELCGELRLDAVLLVNGFGIPDAWLASEMLG